MHRLDEYLLLYARVNHRLLSSIDFLPQSESTVTCGAFDSVRDRSSATDRDDHNVVGVGEIDNLENAD